MAHWITEIEHEWRIGRARLKQKDENDHIMCVTQSFLYVMYVGVGVGASVCVCVCVCVCVRVY